MEILCSRVHRNCSTTSRIAQHLFEYLDAKSRLQPQLMCEAYEAIFHEIVRRSGDVFSKRPSLRNGERFA